MRSFWKTSAKSLDSRACKLSRIGLAEVLSLERIPSSRCAVATIGEILERAGGCVPVGGTLIFMKGPHCDAEIQKAKDDYQGRFALSEDHPYRIPGTTHERRLIIYKKLFHDSPVLFDAHQPSEDDDSPDGTDSSETHSGHGPDRVIESDSNPLVVLLREIQKGKGVRKRGTSLFSGSKVASEIVANFLELALAWITGPEGEGPDREGVPWFKLSKRLFDEFDVFGTHGPLLQVRVPEIQAWVDSDPWPEGCTLFVPFQDPENVGAVVRTAAAFGVARVVLCKEAAHPFHQRRDAPLVRQSCRFHCSQALRFMNWPRSKRLSSLWRPTVSASINRPGRRRSGLSSASKDQDCPIIFAQDLVGAFQSSRGSSR